MAPRGMDGVGWQRRSPRRHDSSRPSVFGEGMPPNSPASSWRCLVHGHPNPRLHADVWQHPGSRSDKGTPRQPGVGACTMGVHAQALVGRNRWMRPFWIAPEQAPAIGQTARTMAWRRRHTQPSEPQGTWSPRRASATLGSWLTTWTPPAQSWRHLAMDLSRSPTMASPSQPCPCCLHPTVYTDLGGQRCLR